MSGEGDDTRRMGRAGVLYSVCLSACWPGWSLGAHSSLQMCLKSSHYMSSNHHFDIMLCVHHVSVRQYVLVGDADIETQLPFVLWGDVQSPAEW